MTFKENEKVGGSAKTAGFVRRMEAEGKLIFHKVSNPSQHLINKYGKQSEPAKGTYEDEPLFDNNETLEFNGSKPKKKNKSKSKEISEAELERQEELKKKQLEEKEKYLNYLLKLKNDTLKIKKELQKSKSDYFDFLDLLKAPHWNNLKRELEEKRKTKVSKIQITEEAHQKHHNNIIKIWNKYTDLKKFINDHKLNIDNLNEIYSFINEQLKQQ